MNRDQLPPHGSATYVLPRWKTVYVSVPKAACTSLKWLVADLQGEDPEHFYKSASRETGRAMTVHVRGRWQLTPRLHDLDDEALAEIRPDNGWFVFGVVRQPAARLWSGWQSKFLLREPRFQDLYPDGPWPRLPQSTADVVEDFQDFVRALTRPEGPASVEKDRHFQSQVRLLVPERTDYTRIYRTDEIGGLMADLEAHLKPLGLEAMPALRRSNETPLPMPAAAFSQEIVDLVAGHYAADLEQFGYVATPTGLVDGYSGDQLAEVGRLVERGERIGDLYQINKMCRENSRLARMEVRELKRQLADARRVQPTALQRVRRKVRRILRTR
jgi:hypothetical protein